MQISTLVGPGTEVERALHPGYYTFIAVAVYEANKAGGGPVLLHLLQPCSCYGSCLRLLADSGDCLLNMNIICQDTGLWRPCIMRSCKTSSRPLGPKNRMPGPPMSSFGSAGIGCHNCPCQAWTHPEGRFPSQKNSLRYGPGCRTR